MCVCMSNNVKNSTYKLNYARDELDKHQEDLTSGLPEVLQIETKDWGEQYKVQ